MVIGVNHTVIVPFASAIRAGFLFILFILISIADGAVLGPHNKDNVPHCAYTDAAILQMSLLGINKVNCIVIKSLQKASSQQSLLVTLPPMSSSSPSLESLSFVAKAGLREPRPTSQEKPAATCSLDGAAELGATCRDRQRELQLPLVTQTFPPAEPTEPRQTGLLVQL